MHFKNGGEKIVYILFSFWILDFDLCLKDFLGKPHTHNPTSCFGALNSVGGGGIPFATENVKLK